MNFQQFTLFLAAAGALNSAAAEEATINWLAGFADEAARTATYAAGTKMVFEWNLDMGPHNVYQMPSAEALAACDFSDATVVDDSTAEGARSAALTIPAGTVAGEQMFFACQIPGHCPLQILTVTVASDAGEAATTEAAAQVVTTEAVTVDAAAPEVKFDWLAGFVDEAARTATYAAGTKMVFEWNLDMGPHNVYQMPSAEALAACDFTEATVVDDSTAEGATSAALTIPAGTAAGEQMFFACQIPGHCPLQILTVTVGDAVPAEDTTAPTKKPAAAPTPVAPTPVAPTPEAATSANDEKAEDETDGAMMFGTIVTAVAVAAGTIALA